MLALHPFIASVLIFSALGANAPCMASQGSASPQSLTPDVVKAIAPNRLYSIGGDKKVACVISKDHKSISFLLPNNPKLLGSCLIRTDDWVLTTYNGFNQLRFKSVSNSGIDTDGHQIFTLYDDNGKPVQIVRGFIDSSGMLNITWLK